LLEVCEQLGLASLPDLQDLATALLPRVELVRQQKPNGGINATQLTIHEPHAPARDWAEIRSMIEAAAAKGFLDEAALVLSLKVFGSIAEAEAAVHGSSVDHVHFHEIGAADSIVDVVGSCYLFARLLPAVAYASPLVLGFGSFSSEHGTMSVPAPATARLMVGLPVESGPYEGEMTTPTGAALAAAFVTRWQPFSAMQVSAVGYGSGTRQLRGASNTVRLLAGDLTSQAPDLAVYLESATLIEANIDHRTPEALAFAAEELLAAGALDVWQEPITMKKGRLAVRLSLLCPPERSSGFADLMLQLTGSLGLRLRAVERVVLPRESLIYDTPWGPVRFKQGHYWDESGVSETDAAAGYRPAWLRPEHDEVARLARATGLAYQQIYDELLRCAEAT